MAGLFHHIYLLLALQGLQDIREMYRLFYFKVINLTVRYLAHSLAVTPGRCCCSVKLQLCHTTQCQQTWLEQAHSKWQPQHGVITVDANTQGNVGYNEQASPLQPVSPLSSMDCRSCTPSYYCGRQSPVTHTLLV